MAYEMKDGQGSLFKNTRKEQDSHADYQGSIKVAGVEYWLNAWIKEGEKGKWMSLSVKPKQQSQPSRQAPSSNRNDSDEIPF